MPFRECIDGQRYRENVQKNQKMLFRTRRLSLWVFVRPNILSITNSGPDIALVIVPGNIRKFLRTVPLLHGGPRSSFHSALSDPLDQQP